MSDRPISKNDTIVAKRLISKSDVNVAKPETSEKAVQCDHGPDKMVGAPLAADSLLYSAYFHPVRQLNPVPGGKVCECIQTKPFYVSPFAELRRTLNVKNNKKKDRVQI